MYEIKAYPTSEICANIKPLPVKRDWMDNTFDKHAYNCFPLTLTNGLGWGVSFPGDIIFKWDGINQSNGGHVKLIEGHNFAYTERENASISFRTGLAFVTDKNVSMLTMPIPNQFIDGISMFTTLISTSFFKGELPAAARVTKSNSEIVIKAHTPIFCVLPISLSDLQNSKINLYNHDQIPSGFFNIPNDYSETVMEINKKGEWSNFYRNATDHKGNKLGNHEVKAIRLETIKKYE